MNVNVSLCVFAGWKIFSVRMCTWCVTVSVWERWLLSSHIITGKTPQISNHLEPWHYGSMCNLTITWLQSHTILCNHTQSCTIKQTWTMTLSHQTLIFKQTRTYNLTITQTLTYMHKIRLIIKQTPAYMVNIAYVLCHNHSHNQALTIALALSGQTVLIA